MQDAEFYATCGLCVPIVIGLREIKSWIAQATTAVEECDATKVS